MSERNSGWKRRFDEPIPLPDGRDLVEHGGPTMFARISVMRALNHAVGPKVEIVSTLPPNLAATFMATFAGSDEEMKR